MHNSAGGAILPFLVVVTLCGCSSNAPAASTTNGDTSTYGEASALSSPSSVGSSGSGGGGGATDPCNLITDAQAAASLGGPATHVAVPPKDIPGGSGVVITEKRCNYSLITSDQTGHDFYLALYAGADRSYFDQSGNDSDFPSISGLGDAAKGSAIDVKVFSRNTMIEVYGSVAAPTGLQDIARLAIARL